MDSARGTLLSFIRDLEDSQPYDVVGGYHAVSHQHTGKFLSYSSQNII